MNVHCSINNKFIRAALELDLDEFTPSGIKLQVATIKSWDFELACILHEKREVLIGLNIYIYDLAGS